MTTMGAVGGTSNAGRGGSGMAGGSMAGRGGSGTQTANLSFEDDVWPILTEMCGECHSTEFASSASADDSYEAVTADSYLGGPRYTVIVGRLERGEMPPDCEQGSPGDPGCVEVEDYNTIKAWSELGPPPPP
jgi:hypothetical protein